MTLLADFARVSRSRPCPICKKPDWCLVSRDDPPSRVICSRIQSSRRFGDAGWLHPLRDGGRLPSAPTRIFTLTRRPAVPDLAALAERFRQQVRPAALTQQAADLGVTATSLARLGIGWDGRAWTFPMSDATGRVRGIRLRFQDGRKLAIRGGRDGLFIPRDHEPGDHLLIAEGPTDTAALLDLGFNAIGRPSCVSGAGLILNFIREKRSKSVVVIADADEPGQRGADSLASTLVAYCRDVRVVTPPSKDARAWAILGATHDDIEEAIRAAPPRRLVIVASATRRSQP